MEQLNAVQKAFMKGDSTFVFCDLNAKGNRTFHKIRWISMSNQIEKIAISSGFNSSFLDVPNKKSTDKGSSSDSCMYSVVCAVTKANFLLRWSAK